MTKRIVGLLLVFAMMISMAQMVTVAETEAASSDSIWGYEAYSDGVMLTAYNGSESDVFIPSYIEVDGEKLQVLKLADGLFQNNDALNSATLGTGILEIGARAFYDCDNLVCVLINEELTTIGDEAFAECAVFNSVILYEAVVHLGADLFKNHGAELTVWCYQDSVGHQYAVENSLPFSLLDAEAIPEIVVVDDVEYYLMNGQAYAVSYSGTASSVVIPAHIKGCPVVELRETFKSCGTITGVALPKTLRNIGLNAFNSCYKLKSIVIPEGVTEIKSSAFGSCRALESVEIPYGVRTIENSAFSGCIKLSSVIIAETVTVIGNSAFANSFTNTEAAVEITIPDSVETLGSSAFKNCTKLAVVHLGVGLTTLKTETFRGCTGLKTVTFSEGLTAIEDSVFQDCTALEELDLSENIKSIGQDAFRECNVLKQIDLPDQLETLGQRAFYQCFALTSIVLPDNLIRLENLTFYRCKAMTAITLPKNITQICPYSALYQSAFTECSSLKEIRIPSTVSKVGKFAFNEGCAALDTVIMEEGAKLPDYNSYGRLFPIHQLKYLAIAGSQETVTVGTFNYQNNLETLILGEGIKKIEKGVATNAVNLKSVLIPQSVTHMDFDAFYITTLLIVHENSYAHNFAKSNGFPFAIYNENSAPHTETINGVTYLIKEDGADAIRYDGTVAEVVLPEEVCGKPLVKVCSIFKNSSVIKSVYIPDTVKEITKEAFSGCSNLTSVRLSEGLTLISPYLFYNCEKLESLSLPASVTEIETYAFNNCKALQSIQLYEGLKIIRDYAFGGCSSLQTMVFPETITTLGVAVLSGCSSLKSATLPSVIKKIPDNFFKSCTSLENLPNSATITSIGSGAFQGCTALKKIEIASSVTSIGANAFSNTGVEEVVVPDINLGNGIFSGCKQLKKATVHKTNVPTGTFSDCTLLETVLLAEETTQIADRAFVNCTSLKSITIPNNVTVISISAFSGCTALESVTIPEKVTTVSSYAFSGCTALKTVYLPESLRVLDTYAFADCTTLEEISIPAAVTLLNSYVFKNCTNLKKVVLTEGLVNVKASAFENCTALDWIHVPQSVTTLVANSFPSTMVLQVYEGSYAHQFALDNTHVYLLYTGEEIKGIIKDAGCRYCIIDGKAVLFYYEGDATEIEIPDKVSDYPVTEIRSVFKNNTALTAISLPETLEIIGREAFRGCTGLTTLEIPTSVKRIDEYAFEGCSGIETVSLPQGVSEIGNYAFSGCEKMQLDLKLDAVKKLGTYAFKACHGLNSVQISGELQQIETGTFYNCDSLKTVVLDGNIQVIGSDAFRDCALLETVILPDALTEIGSYSFSGCSKMNKIDLPDSLQTLSVGAFYQTSLSSVRIPANITEIESYTFYGADLNEGVVFEGEIQNIKGYAFAYSDLTEIEIPASVNRISTMAFGACDKLVSLEIPEGVCEIGEKAFYACYKLTSIELPDSVTVIEARAFQRCVALVEIRLPGGLERLSEETFDYCIALETVLLSESLKEIQTRAFSNASALKSIYIPSSVESIATNSFATNVILLVNEDSPAHRLAMENDWLYFVLHQVENPNISYGTSVSGMVTYMDGTAAVDATVSLFDGNGQLKETVKTNENGQYALTYAEVGTHLLKAEDADGNTYVSKISIKRKNVFDVFLMGDTHLMLKKGWAVSGTVSEDAVVSITDENGDIIVSQNTLNGAFFLENIPNGSYILKAESENGIAKTEITIYNADITDLTLTIETSMSGIWGYVEVKDLDNQCHRRNWVEVTLYDEEGLAVAKQKSDADGKYVFKNLPLGSYSIVAETAEMRFDPVYGYVRSYTMTGYGYIELEQEAMVQADTIILAEETNSLATIEGKVTAHGETQDCRVILQNVFRHEIAQMKTEKNGKYRFDSVRDGLYFITAITNSEGMGFAVVLVINGEVYGDTDITVYKSDKIKQREDKFYEDVPQCNNREDVLKYRHRIAEEKRFYDGLSKREKQQLSKDYLDQLMRYFEWLADCEYVTNEDVSVEGGLVISDEELETEKEISFNLNVEKKENYKPNKNKVETDDDFIFHEMEDNANGKKIKQYYEITMTKTVDGEEKIISNVCKETTTTGNFRITMRIPEEYRGYKHYSVLHVHNGEVVTLTDLDEDPDTITFEVDRFSTFALSVTNESLTHGAADHIYQNGCDTSCDICGELREITHSFGDYVANGDGTETKTCSVCGLQESRLEYSTATAVRLLKYIDGHDVGLTQEQADISGDGKVSIFDAVRFMQLLNSVSVA